MKRFLSIVILAATLAACGGGADDNNVEALNQKLNEKRSELAALTAEVKSIEEQLDKVDPARKELARAKAVIAKPVALRDFKHFIQVQGTIEARENVMVNPKSPGIITRVFVREGDMVRKGQVLAQGDNSVYIANLQELETRLDLATTLFEKQDKLWAEKIGSEVQYLNAKNQKESLEKSIKTLKSQLALNNITSPIDGVVDMVNIKAGEVASPGMGVIRVVNTSDVKVTAKVADTHVSDVKNGDKVIVRLPDTQDTIIATVSYVGRVVDRMTRTFDIEIQLPKNSQKQVKPNMIAIININDKTLNEAVVIDENLTQFTEEGPVVFVVADSNGKKVAKMKSITTGLRYNGLIQVTDGLSAGDQLIVTGYQDLVDGQLLKL